MKTTLSNAAWEAAARSAETWRPEHGKCEEHFTKLGSRCYIGVDPDMVPPRELAGHG